MRINNFILSLLALLLLSCNTTFLNHKDFVVTQNDFDWTTKIEDQVGEIYLVNDKILYGRNWDSTFLELSEQNGKILDELNTFTIDKEREPLILDSIRVFKNGYSLYNVSFQNLDYSTLTLKAVDRQYRGDNETFYLILKTNEQEERVILFDRDEFSFISDIIHLNKGKFLITYNGESANSQHKYFQNIGLLDLDKIMTEK
jgi:hypothetical protein